MRQTKDICPPPGKATYRKLLKRLTLTEDIWKHFQNSNEDYVYMDLAAVILRVFFTRNTFKVVLFIRHTVAVFQFMIYLDGYRL